MRDICFSNDGRQFLSTGYDKNIRLWDTETGQVVQTFNTGKVSRTKTVRYRHFASNPARGFVPVPVYPCRFVLDGIETCMHEDRGR